MPLHVSSTCAHHQQVKIALHSLWYHYTRHLPLGHRTLLDSDMHTDPLLDASMEASSSGSVCKGANVECDDTRDCVMQY